MTSAYKMRTEKTWFDTEDQIALEFRRWHVKEWKVTKVGNGARVRWMPPRPGAEMVNLESTDQRTAAENLRKLFYVVQYLRNLEAKGFSQLVGDYYAQTMALAVRPEDAATTREPWQILGVAFGVEQEVVEAAYRALAKRYHPDTVSDADKAQSTTRMREANAAMTMIRQQMGWT